MESSSCVTPPQPDFCEFERLLTSLATLAQRTYTLCPTARKITTGARYARLQSKIHKFFCKHRNFDFVADGSYGYCLEMQSLAQLIEISFRWIGMEHEVTAWPIAELGHEEEAKLKKEVYREVDALVFRREKIQFRRGRWSMRGANEEDAISQDAISQDTISQDAISQDTISQDAISQDTISQDTISQDASSPDANSEDAEDASSTDACSEDANSESGESLSTSISSFSSQTWTQALAIRTKDVDVGSDLWASDSCSESPTSSHIWTQTLAIRAKDVEEGATHP